MHIHGSSPNSYAANLYAAGNDPQTVAARRAAETRKKLLRAAQSADIATSADIPEETVLISHWTDTTAQDSVHPYATHPPRDSDFD